MNEIINELQKKYEVDKESLDVQQMKILYEYVNDIVKDLDLTSVYMSGYYDGRNKLKNKLKEILGVDFNDEKIILDYINTLEEENARLEDIEDKKVQIEYELVFNQGVESIKKHIKAIRDKAEIMDHYTLNNVIDDLTKLIGDEE